MVKIIISSIVFLFTINLVYSESMWRVLPVKQDFYLLKGKTAIKILSVGGKPSFVKISHPKEIHPYQLLIFHAGTSGTKYMTRELYAIIYNPITKENRGIFPWKYIRDETNENIPLTDPPEWTFTKNQIKIKDIRANINLSILLKK